jgi:predicted O-methyltransferase YrrM
MSPSILDQSVAPPTTNGTTISSPKQAFKFNPTQNWTVGHGRYPTWLSLLKYVKSESPKVLEIGSWEGRSGVFFLQNLCGRKGDLTCIDHFDLLRTKEGRERHERVIHNFGLTGGKHRVLCEYSVPGLYKLLLEALSSPEPGYDWIYVDGSHEGDDTCLDGELAWRIAREGAVFVFDDYRWIREPETSRHHPRRGIDAFLQLHKGEYEILTGSEPDQYQMILLKKSPLRIGFAARGHTYNDRETIEGAINIALTLDPKDVPATISRLQNIVATTPGQIHFFIACHDISTPDKNEILKSVAGSTEIVLDFVELSPSTLAVELGLKYAKIDLMGILPVKRALFLDTIAAIEISIYEVWRMEMDGRPVAAVTDASHPMGHEGIREGPYFNASILLANISQVQEKHDSLALKARKMKNSKFPCQDALNVHFEYDWMAMDVKIASQDINGFSHAGA